MTPDEGNKAKGLELPEKVTLAWLFGNVPVSVWLSLGGAIITAFVLGVAAGQTTFIKELIGGEQRPTLAEHRPLLPEQRAVAEPDKSLATQTPVPTPTATPIPIPALSPADAAIQVWVNTDSGVYHCPGSKWYGKTTQGRHMTQGQAVEANHKPAYGRLCRK
jgi:hypothetical protein